MRLSFDTLATLPRHVQRPGYDVSRLQYGIVHLGVGAFHRAHQAVFTEDAIAHSGGDWGIIGVSMRKPNIAKALAEQDGLYTVETLSARPGYRVVGTIREALCLPHANNAVLDTIARRHTRVVTLTVTENGYCLINGNLDLTHPDIVHDLRHPDTPRSAIGVLVAGLARRQGCRGTPITVISCDNLAENGRLLGEAVCTLSERQGRGLTAWITTHVTFPESVVDCIVPASSDESRARADFALGLNDAASVQREPFAQWVIEDHFAAPRPDWSAVGVELVASCANYRRLKLHVLNAAHSTLAYLGLARGLTYVREAAADPAISRFLDEMISREIAPALPGLAVDAYWKKTVQRFTNPMSEHRLAQVALDGAAKLSQRLSPLMLSNAKARRPYSRMAAVYAAWVQYMDRSETLSRATLDELSDPVWRIPELRNAILENDR